MKLVASLIIWRGGVAQAVLSPRPSQLRGPLWSLQCVQPTAVFMGLNRPERDAVLYIMQLKIRVAFHPRLLCIIRALSSGTRRVLRSTWYICSRYRRYFALICLVLQGYRSAGFMLRREYWELWHHGFRIYNLT